MLPILAGSCLQLPISLVTYGAKLNMMTYIQRNIPMAMYIGRGNQIAYGLLMRASLQLISTYQPHNHSKPHSLIVIIPIT